MQNFLKKLLKNDFFVVGVVFLILLVIISYMNKAQEGLEVTGAGPEPIQAPVSEPLRGQPQVQLPPQQPLSPRPQEQTAEALLQPQGPAAEAAEFVQKNEVMDLLKEKNFLVAGQHVGLDTVLQSKKIAYHDIRSAPPIPKEQVGPWNQSSYEQPAGGPVARRYLEIGSQ
jgi:hypothetical protein